MVRPSPSVLILSLVSDYIPDMYDPSSLLVPNEVGLFTNQSNPFITDPFQFEAQFVNPADHDAFTFVGVHTWYCPNL